MGCNGCQTLIGDSAKFTTGPTVISATGLSLQEVVRIFVPPSRDTLQIRGWVHVAANTVGQEAVVQAALVPASSLNILSAVAGDGSDEVPHTGIIAVGHKLTIDALFEPDEYAPGDWVLGVQRPSGGNAANVNATTIVPACLMWRR